MKEAQSAPEYGRTNWRRFAAAVALPAVATVGLGVALQTGALAASFSISGQQFKLSATKLEGQGFTQYSGALKDGKGTVRPAAMSGINEARIYDLCQSVNAGPITLRIEAGKNHGGDKEKAVYAEDLLIGMSELSGDAEFKNIEIGRDASTLDADGAKEHGEVGGFGQQADSVTINGLRQQAYSTQASTFRLKGMSLKLLLGSGNECY